MEELDFSKIFGETATSKASFTDENYINGWGYLGSTPPPYQLFDYLQGLNDKKSKYLYDRINDNKNNLLDHNTDSSAHTEMLNTHNADVNAHNPITDMIASITGEPNWQIVPTHNLATVLNDSVKRAVDIVGGRADVILTPLIDWQRIKTEKGGTDARTGSPTDNYFYALMKAADVTNGKIYLKTAFTDYDELIFEITNDDRKSVLNCTYTTKEFYELLNGKGERIGIGGAGSPPSGYSSEGSYSYFWSFGTFNNQFSTVKSTVNYLCTGSAAGWENCGLVEIYGVTYPRA